MKKHAIIAMMLFVSLALCLLSAYAKAQDEGKTDITGNNMQLPLSAVTASSGCYFDVDSSQQFRLIFTNDPTTPSPSVYKLAASNPGQFYYNVFYTGTSGSSVSPLTITIPYPFVTQGAVPIQIYSSASIVKGAFVPSDDITSLFTIATAGATTTPSGAAQIVLTDYSPQRYGSTTTITITPNAGTSFPPTGLVYVAVHLDYGLKGTPGYVNSGGDAVDFIDTLVILIPNTGSYAFSVAGGVSDTQTIINQNVFKRDTSLV